MPHECTNCNRTFPDGSKRMLSGCPDCGGNKFRYRPTTEATDDADGTDGPGEAGEAGGTDDPGETGERSRDDPDRPDGPGGRPRDGSEGRSRPTDPHPGPDADPGAGSRVSDVVRGASATVRDWVGRDAERSRRPDRDRPSWSPGSAPSAGGGDPTEPPVDGERGTDGEPGESDPTPDGEDAAQASARSSMVDPEELPDRSGPAGVGSSRGGTDPGSRSVGGEADREPGADDRSPGTPTAPSGGTAADPGDSTADEGSKSACGPEGAGSTPGPAESGSTSGRDEAGSLPGTDHGGGDEGPELSELRRELNDQFESIKIVEPGQYELNLMELYDREEYIISLMEDGRYAIEVPETWREGGGTG